MYHFNSDVLVRLEVAVALVNAHLGAEGASRSGAIFTDRGYAPPPTADDWDALERTARDVAKLLSLIAKRDQGRTLVELNRQLAAHHVTLQLEQTASCQSLHFHAATATFAEGWAAGIAAALAIACSCDEAQRIGRCQAKTCPNYFVDRGKNRKRRFCSIQCQNRSKSMAYRERAARGKHLAEATHVPGPNA